MKEVMMIVEAIEESDLFKGVSPEFLNEIGTDGELKNFKRGATYPTPTKKHATFINSSREP